MQNLKQPPQPQQILPLQAVRTAAQSQANATIARVNALCQSVKVATISTPEQYNGAGQMLRQIRTLCAQLDKERKEKTDPLHKLKSWIISLYNPPIVALNSLAQQINLKMDEWDRVQLREKQRQEAALQKLQQKEKQKQLSAMERKAEKLEKMGDTEGAEYLKHEAQELAMAPIAAPAVVSVTTAAEGVSSKQVPYWRVDLEKADPSWRQDQDAITPKMFPEIPDEYWTLDEKKLNRVVKSCDGKLRIPGIAIGFSTQRAARKINDEEMIQEGEIDYGSNDESEG